MRDGASQGVPRQGFVLPPALYAACVKLLSMVGVGGTECPVGGLLTV